MSLFHGQHNYFKRILITQNTSRLYEFLERLFAQSTLVEICDLQELFLPNKVHMTRTVQNGKQSSQKK